MKLFTTIFAFCFCLQEEGSWFQLRASLENNRTIRLVFVFLAAAFSYLNATAQDVRSSCPISVAEDYFFAEGTFDKKTAVREQHTRLWYSSHLGAMAEVSLSCGKEAGSETYRFTWLRTFHHPIAVQIFQKAETIRLVSVELNGAGGYAPGAILKKVEKDLPLEQWKKLLAGIDAAKVWSLPARDAARQGFDGSEWIIEARQGDRYHAVTRWTPEPGSYRQLGLLFLELAQLEIPLDETY